MLDNPYTYIGAIIVILAGCILYVAYTAPKGYEDRDGFHYGWEDEE